MHTQTHTNTNTYTEAVNCKLAYAKSVSRAANKRGSQSHFNSDAQNCLGNSDYHCWQLVDIIQRQQQQWQKWQRQFAGQNVTVFLGQ